MNYRIPLAVPDIGMAEELAVMNAMRSGWVAPAGPDLDAFEGALATSTDREFAVAVSSGTAALHLALLAVGVRSGDLVPCATLTFAATANAIRYVGATPVFIDCDSSGTMDPTALDEALRLHTATGRRIGAIVPVDLFGKMADYDSIAGIADRYQVPVVSDAAESLGAVAQGHPAGSRGHIAALSFNGNKIITTSSGGAVVTDSDALASRVRHLATQARQPVRHYEHEEVGYNYRLSNILAALGTAQLGRLESIMDTKRAHREAYRQMCERAHGISILGGRDAGDNCWLTGILVDPHTSPISSEAVIDALAERGIEARPVFKPMHLQPVFADPAAFPRYDNGVATAMYAHGLLLPSGTSLTSSDRNEVIAAVEGVVMSKARVAS